MAAVFYGNDYLPLNFASVSFCLVKIRYTELKLLCGNLCGRPPARPPAIPNHIRRTVSRRAYTNRANGKRDSGYLTTNQLGHKVSIYRYNLIDIIYHILTVEKLEAQPTEPVSLT
jgi:hypothetical protein